MQYEAEPKIRGLLEKFWSRQEVVARQNEFHGPQLLSYMGTTQGVLTSPKLSNVSLDSMVRRWLSLTVEDESAIHDGLGMDVGRIMRVFHADDSLIGSRDL